MTTPIKQDMLVLKIMEISLHHFLSSVQGMASHIQPYLFYPEFALLVLMLVFIGFYWIYQKYLVYPLRIHPQVLKNVNKAISLFDEQGVLVYTNPAFNQMFPYKVGEVLEHINLQTVFLRLKGAKSWSEQTQVRRKDGLVIYINSEYSVIPIKRKEYYLCVQKDITEAHKKTQAMQEYTERLQLALSQGSMGSWDWTFQTDTIIWDGYTEQLLGFAPHSFPGTKEAFLKVVHPEDQVRVIEEMLQAAQNHKDYIIEYRVIWPDGTVHWISARGHALYDENDFPYRMVGTMHDITTRKHAEEMFHFLAEAGRKLVSSLDYTETLQTLARFTVPKLADWCIVHMVQSDGTLKNISVIHSDSEKLKIALELREKYPLSWNNEFHIASKVLLNGTSQLYSEVPNELLLHVSQDDRQLHILNSLGIKSVMCVPLKARGKIIGIITLISSESGKRYNEKDLTIAEDLAKRAALAVDNASLFAEQVTARQEIESLVTKLKDALAARDEFLSIASHELKTPITALKLQLQLAQRNVKANADPSAIIHQLAKILDTSTRQVDRLTCLVEDLLDVARVRAGKFQLSPTEVRVVDLVRDVIDRFANQLAFTNSRVELSVDTGIVGNWDCSRIEQVLVNLVSNSIKYASGSPIHISAHQNADWVTLQVRDQGPGISKEIQPLIFERFERGISSQNISGLGLGLFITRQIVEAHQGTISVESEIDQGANFVVRLPNQPNFSDLQV